MAQKLPKSERRVAALPLSPELSDLAPNYAKSLGFVPNSVLIMQRKPKLVRAFTALTAAVWDPESEVDRGFKRLVAHVASRAHGCHY
jgi:alkylhydroperoxidase family enzyme